METHYDILGIDRNASPQQIKNAYRELMKHHHPDLNADSADATQRAQHINTAYEVLKDPVKRYEYDNLLMLRMSPTDVQNGFAFNKTEDGIVMEAGEGFVCEGCGSSNPSLRVTIFTGVFSLLFSWKKSWGRILCSSCRIKYGLLWNLEVWFAGWWSIPFGPWNSATALARNAGGGFQPVENNALLLASLAHSYYLDHRYVEALSCVSESLRLRMTKGGLEFRAQVIDELRRTPHASARKKSRAINPLVFHIPVLTVLAVASIWAGLSLFSGPAQTETDSARISPLSSTETSPPPNADELAGIAAAYGINTEVIGSSLQKCREARAVVAGHIASHTPENQQAAEDSPAPTYIIQWDKLDDNLLRQQQEIIGSAVTDASFEMRKLATTNPESEDPSIGQGRQILNGEFDEMVSILFNCSLLSSGTTFLKPTATSAGLFPDQAIDEIKQLGEKTEVTPWLSRSKYEEPYRNLLTVLENARMNSGRYRVMHDRMQELLADVREDSAQLATLRTRMEEYKANGAQYEYNQISALYESKLPQANQHILEYNDYLHKYNEFTQGLNKDEISSAIIACMDPLALFPR